MYYVTIKKLGIIISSFFISSLFLAMMNKMKYEGGKQNMLMRSSDAFGKLD